jgi:hypothetical protein
VAVLLWLPSVALAQSPSSSAQEHVEARITKLHAQLGITPAQEPQWGQFAQTMRDNARELRETAQQRTQQFPTMTAVQNMASYEKLAESHVQHLQKLVPAFQSVYDVMSPDQKQVADQVFRERSEDTKQQASIPNRPNRQAQNSRGYRHYRRYRGYSQAEALNREELARLVAGR